MGVEFSGGGRNIKEAGEVAVEEPAWGVPGPLERTEERPGTIAEETSKVENRAGNLEAGDVRDEGPRSRCSRRSRSRCRCSRRSSRSSRCGRRHKRKVRYRIGAKDLKA